MDLGKAKLLRSGVNTLHRAIHPMHGIAWTDGRQVCLTALYFVHGEVKFGDTNVIGQFEHVLGLFWGPLCCPDSPALLAVQHKKHVSVWQLQLSTLEHNKLLCTQTCEMSEPFPLLPQGCVWHPKLDILALLTKRDASVLFSVRVDNRRTKVDIKGSGLIHCACWTKDGTRLVVAIGSELHSYVWNDIHKSLVVCSFCPIFDVGGYICAMEATGDSQVAVATELPLEKLCGLNAGMAFEMPPEADPPQSQTLENDPPLDSRRRSFESERSHATSLGPLDLTHLLAKHRRSDPSPLIHLRRKDAVTGSGQDSSHLVLITYERKVTTTRRVSIPGILVPDIVAFDPRASTVAVASNTCNMVLVYCITPSAMPNIQQISLQANDRPKGVCFLSDKVLLLMVGRQKSMDPAFLPSSNTEKYILCLLAKELMCDREGGISPAPSPLNPESPCNFPGIRTYSEDRERPGIKDFVLPGMGVVRSPGSRRRLVEEVRSGEASPVTSSVDFSLETTQSSASSSVAVENFDADHVSRMASLAVAGQACRESGRAASPCPELNAEAVPAPPPVQERLGGGVGPGRERALEQLVCNTERLFARFADVQHCLSEIRDYTQNGKKVLSIYPSTGEPPYVNITCQKQLSENVFIDERRPVLLCDGKLCLRAVQELFNLSIVEMLHGPLWIVLVADADGFVPLTFNPKEELTVRNGMRKSTLRTPENSCSSSPAPGHNPNMMMAEAST
ncbi:WD repeat and coiled-coil-containing protein [Dunckerocampus dactyliophorus]|uniref:WD repeat and coiled-coil-containing protein n=1 Tax=Dunckerocampus dactyliophorus TaxID=161453 RepID=UPI0024072C31|nr:WD repeat and coiled-coil-containing protein [Dunckerocampus dactyliophorus]XP_054618021.1 WD repeat and coiled-coil-containing protein [Dunckerocampus dactyliophorus]